MTLKKSGSSLWSTKRYLESWKQTVSPYQTRLLQSWYVFLQGPTLSFVLWCRPLFLSYALLPFILLSKFQSFCFGTFKYFRIVEKGFNYTTKSCMRKKETIRKKCKGDGSTLFDWLLTNAMMRGIIVTLRSYRELNRIRGMRIEFYTCGQFNQLAINWCHVDISPLIAGMFDYKFATKLLLCVADITRIVCVIVYYEYIHQMYYEINRCLSEINVIIVIMSVRIIRAKPNSLRKI